MSKEDFAATPQAANIHYGPEAPPSQSEFKSLSRHRESAPGEPGPVAVLVCHGMGQQVRYETIGQVAAAILKEAARLEGTIETSGVQLSCHSDEFLTHAELNWTTPSGSRHQVHVYEAYWAPLTEGKVTYYETLKFLVNAGLLGLRRSITFSRSFSWFNRWMFGRLQKLRINPATWLAILAMLAFILLEAALIATALALVAAKLKELSAYAWPSTITMGSVFSTLKAMSRDVLRFLAPQHQALHAWPFTWVWLSALLKTCGWIFFLVHGFFIRFFLTEYAGDVAAYISPYKDSKFEEIRHEIQLTGLRVAKVIYGFTPSPVLPHYDRVVFVGHSLGSVLAYDTLNAIINLDLTANEPLHVVRRTTNLITFGSPLNKTAFIFRNQSNHVEDPLREQMAAASQPLILKDSFRSTLKWHNLWSYMDVISGPLNYYNDQALPAKDPHNIHSEKDPAAWFPFYAHVQYWTGKRLAAILHEAVTQAPNPPTTP